MANGNEISYTNSQTLSGIFANTLLSTSRLGLDGRLQTCVLVKTNGVVGIKGNLFCFNSLSNQYDDNTLSSFAEIGVQSPTYVSAEKTYQYSKKLNS